VIRRLAPGNEHVLAALEDAYEKTIPRAPHRP
jgi:hypothetical protein